MGRKCVHGLETDTVQTHGLLVSLGVVLTACVEDAHSLHHGVQRNTSSEVAYCCGLLVYSYLDLLSESSRELVDGVVDHFLEEHVDAVSQILSVTQSSDVHSRTSADMFDAFERLDVVVCIINNLCHKIKCT